MSAVLENMSQLQRQEYFKDELKRLYDEMQPFCKQDMIGFVFGFGAPDLSPGAKNMDGSIGALGIIGFQADLISRLSDKLTKHTAKQLGVSDDELRRACRSMERWERVGAWFKGWLK